MIEINARTTNLNSLLYKVGLNFPYITYKEMIGENIGAKTIDYDTGIVFRYLYEDLLAIRDYTRKGQLTHGSIIKSLFSKKAPAVWSFSDPKPGFDYLGMMMKKVAKKLKG